MTNRRSWTTMPFGKHFGRDLADVPSDYLCWVLRECDIDSKLESAIHREMRKRDMPTRYLLLRMDSEISDDEFGRIAEELNRRGPCPGWGIANTSSSPRFKHELESSNE